MDIETKALPASMVIGVQEELVKRSQDGLTYHLHSCFDDSCGNGHNTFSMTVDTYKNGRMIACGCQHDIVEKVFPEYAKYIKWHLCSTDGPLHYIANTMYWQKEHNFKNAKASAIWPDCRAPEDMNKWALEDRLPDLMIEFKAAMESLGFTY